MSVPGTNSVFAQARVLVGVSGGIAAYKACTLVSRLVQAGADVSVAMTPSACEFVTALTFQALSGKSVYTSVFADVEPSDPQHIRIARAIDLVIVAPCTMNTLAKIATGFCDDVLTLILSAVDQRVVPVLLAPSMNAQMWEQPSTQRNLQTLHTDGYRSVGPESGWQACRTVGAGRMTEPEAIIAEAEKLLWATKRA